VRVLCRPRRSTADAELAAEIDRDYAHASRLRPADRHRVLKGSVFFLVDLLKRVSVPVTVGLFQTSSYGQGTVPARCGSRKDVRPLDPRHDVLLIEDIVDTGHTPLARTQSCVASP